MFERIKGLFSASHREAALQERLEQLRQHLPVPMFWLFGKTQSGKTTLIKYLTGADQAEIGKGFRACTRFSREYQFPTQEAPLLNFLDTRGLDEPGYDPAEDLARFNDQAHVVVVTVKALDHAQENVLEHLRTIRAAQPTRPVVLVLTCLHEAYPQQQHPLPCPFGEEWERGGAGAAVPEAGATAPATPPALLPPPSADGIPPCPAPSPDLLRSLDEQRRRFGGLADRVVAVDLTPPEEGFNDPEYGGPRLHEVLIEVLPGALRQTLLTLDKTRDQLQDFYATQALPHIIGYSTLAASAGALPVPVVDVLLLSAIQSRMVYDLARLYGQPLTAKRFLEIAGSTGLGILVRQAARGLLKLIPMVGSVVGSVAGGALAGASTFALGKAFCYYYQAVHHGHVPRAQDLRRYYKEQLALAEKVWKSTKDEGQGTKEEGQTAK